MKKAFDQTVRDLKREVNKKVLKVPGIEQKVLDATSNEPWGPHGSLLADIAQATRNYHEYQMIMTIIWKRINDTGKNWRHVYKALTVLEYLVANGSERVIDDIREHGYQISTLADFQYIDSSGRDQGNNVRKKSQSLVVLVNDKERIIEVRQKAAANRDKFHSTSAGGMYRSSSYTMGGYGDKYDDERYEGRYGNRDEDRNGYGYGRDREYNNRDDDRYGRYGDSYNRDGDRYGRDYEERYGRDGYRDDDYRGRSRSVDDFGSRSRSLDRERDQAPDDDGQSSSQRLERKFSEQNIGAPPSYEETVGESKSPAHGERNGETSVVSVPPAPRDSSPSASNAPSEADATFGKSASPAGQEAQVVDEFDPRSSFPAAPNATSAPAASSVVTASNNTEMDLLGALSDSFAPNPLAIMPVATTTETDNQTNFSGTTFAATQSETDVMNQSFEDPFGDSPFKAVTPLDANSTQQQTSASAAHFQTNQNSEMPHAATMKADTVNNSGNMFNDMTYSASNIQSHATDSQFLPPELSTSQQETDILADILPPSGPPAIASQAGFSAPTGQHVQPVSTVYGNFTSQAGPVVPASSNTGPQSPQLSGGNFLPQGVSETPIPSNMALQTPVGSATQFNNGNIFPQQGSASFGSQTAYNNANFHPQQSAAGPVTPQSAYQGPTGPAAQRNNDVLGNLFSQGQNTPIASQSAIPSSTGSPATSSQPAKDKFETKSTVWADTLSRGLVNLNISGPKINPLADIGVDFDAINRKEKRLEKPTTTAVTSTVNMGKAMGSGSGMGRAGASSLRPPNPMMGPGMGMGVGMGMPGGPGAGMGMGGYGSMQQPMGMGGYGRMQQPMGMGMGQGGPMRPPTGLPSMPRSYNPYAQQPYGSGYR